MITLVTHQFARALTTWRETDLLGKLGYVFVVAAVVATTLVSAYMYVLMRWAGL